MASEAFSFYYSVPCLTCSKPIDLAPIIEDKDTGQEIPFPSLPDPFEAACDDGHVGTYAKCTVVPRQGPAMTPSFRIHSAFLPSRQPD
jgi:hypothetical protein